MAWNNDRARRLLFWTVFQELLVHCREALDATLQ